MSPKNCYNDCWNRFDIERDTVFVKVVLRYKVNDFSLYDICEHQLRIMQNYKYYIEYWTVCVLKLCKILIAVRQSACLIGVFICLWVCLSWNATCLRCVCRPYCAECLCLSLLSEWRAGFFFLVCCEVMCFIFSFETVPFLASGSIDGCLSAVSWRFVSAWLCLLFLTVPAPNGVFHMLNAVRLFVRCITDYRL